MAGVGGGGGDGGERICRHMRAPYHQPLMPHADPDGFHLEILAAVAKLYLGLSGRGVEDEGVPQYPSDLWAAFESRGLGPPDFAMFWDYARCAVHIQSVGIVFGCLPH